MKSPDFMLESGRFHEIDPKSVADPGFPIGGVPTSGGGHQLSSSYIPKNLYVKMKESGPVGGARRRRPLDPPLQMSQGPMVLFLKVRVLISFLS